MRDFADQAMMAKERTQSRSGHGTTAPLVSMAERQVFNQQYGVDCATENDSEILLRKIVGRTEPLMRDRIASAMTEVAFIEHPIHACGLLTNGATTFAHSTHSASNSRSF